MRAFSLGLLLILAFGAQSQNLRCKSFVQPQGKIYLDTLLIEPGSITLVPAVPYTYNSATQAIEISTAVDEVEICYRVIAPELFKPRFVRDRSTYEPTAVPKTPGLTAHSDSTVRFKSDVQKSGFISRGITFGNRQDVFVNSTLNLQMSGRISENLYIDAVITDQNIPFQPEGNTQQIRDFDNVYIKLYNDNFDLTVGDIVLTNPFSNGYFLQYYKNVQGIQLNYFNTTEKWKTHSHVAASAAKGKFASVQLEPIEGSLGPYRLVGPNGERFLVVLANSEKVFLDGKLLTRGYDFDYTIDYNLGQITFTTDVIITRFSIIRVDYEYAEQYYARTAFSAGQQLTNDKWDIRVNYYTERDNPAGSLGFQPSEEDLLLLQAIGDDVALAQISGTDSIAFNPNQVLYRRLDTLNLDGDTQTIYQYSTDPANAFFVVSFTEVGFGNGDYILSSTTTNGRVYEWVSPQGGVRQGNYDPTRQVPTPLARRMMTMAVNYRIGKYESVSQEFAFSHLDKNLYSDLDDNDNQGMAWMGRLRSHKRVLLPGYTTRAELQWEYDQRNFKPIDRYRPILFDRDWDYTSDNGEAEDYMIWLKSGLYKNDNQQMEYQLVRRERDGAINGWQHQARLNQRLGHFQFSSDHFLLKNEQGQLASDWIRTSNDLSFRKGWLVPGYIFSLDQNTLSAQDSIVSTRMYFNAHEYYLTNGDTAVSKFRLSYQRRTDYLPQEGELDTYTLADNYGADFRRNLGKHQLGLSGRYRYVRDQINDLTDEWLNGRVDWVGSFFKEVISHQLSYQIGNVRELKRDFIFVEVGGNQGTHAWRDENGDGIKDLNEFYEAVNPDERQYAKFFTPTDDFITAFETRYQHTISTSFPSTWRSASPAKRFFHKWSSQMSLNAHFKTQASETSKRLNPFGINERNQDVIFAANRWRYVLYYNRSYPGLGWEGSYALTERKQLLTSGFELGEMEEWRSGLSWRFQQEYTLRFNNVWMHQLNSSDFLLNRNLDIVGYGLGPELIWQPTHALRVIGEYQYRKKENTLATDTPERSTVSEWHGNVTWTKGAKGTLNGDIRLLQIGYDGASNTFAAYQLLEALQPGNNATWRLNWQQTLGKGVHMTVQYNGRKSEEQPAIHTGTMMLTAYF